MQVAGKATWVLEPGPVGVRLRRLLFGSSPAEKAAAAAASSSCSWHSVFVVALSMASPVCVYRGVCMSRKQSLQTHITRPSEPKSDRDRKLDDGRVAPPARKNLPVRDHTATHTQCLLLGVVRCMHKSLEGPVTELGVSTSTEPDAQHEGLADRTAVALRDLRGLKNGEADVVCHHHPPPTLTTTYDTTRIQGACVERTIMR